MIVLTLSSCHPFILSSCPDYANNQCRLYYLSDTIMTNTRLDLAAVQARLATAQGRDYWRSLEELAETDSFQEFLHREFPRQASEWTPAMNRRNFLKLMGASLALAGLTACASE